MNLSLPERFADARQRAKKKGLTLEESGCPRGERRWYTLRDERGTIIKESPSITVTEKAISDYAPFTPSRLISCPAPGTSGAVVKNPFTTGEHMSKATLLTLGSDDAALVFKANGEMDSFLPEGLKDGDDTPAHVHSAFLCMLMLSEGNEDIQQMLNDRAHKMLETLKSSE